MAAIHPEPTGFRFSIARMLWLTAGLAFLFQLLRVADFEDLAWLLFGMYIATPTIAQLIACAVTNPGKRRVRLAISLALLVLLLVLALVVQKGGGPGICIGLCVISYFVWIVQVLFMRMVYLAWKAGLRSAELPLDDRR